MKRLLRRLLFPLTWFDNRFRSLHEHVDVAVEHHLEPAMNERFDRVDSLRELMADLIERVSSDTQTAAEFAATFRRSTDRVHHELAALWAFLAAGPEPRFAELLRRCAAGDGQADLELAKLLYEQLPGLCDRIVGAHEGIRLPIGPGTADFLNWSNGHQGPAAQAGVWFNPPVTVFHHDGTVRANDVNERIVEIPYVLGAVASLPAGSRVLDFGATESTVALSLAALGHDVVAADLRPYPLQHPRLHSLVGPIEEWEGPEHPFDAVVCLSAIEHVGLGAYEEAPTDGDLDRAIVERFGRWLRPGGELVLTAPYGRWEVGETQRVYDGAHLDALLAGWRVVDRAVCVQTGHDRWERADGEPDPSTWDDGTRGVVLVRVTPDA
ncbi:MAG TPA: methyltransferase domain-containing protein [Acidimicrobiales bacterium]|nr:methyltransferase domain-containing protein [Acidimicrobiales bacterium]